LRARELAKVDDFGLTNCHCIVTWNGEDVLTTEVVQKSLNPEFDNETAILKLPWLPSQVQARVNSQTLLIEVWEKNSYGIGDFLGMINLTGTPLMDFLDNRSSATGYEMTFPLEKNTALAIENNQMVQGNLYLWVLKLKHIPSNVIVSRFSKAQLKIERAINLPKADVFGTSDAIVYIFCSCSLLGNFQRIFNILSSILK
jgi:hypothetical protein